MSKPEGWRLDPASYPFTTEVQTRWGDMDLLGHINNVAMAALFETGRVAFNHALSHGPLQRGGRWLIARQAIDYVNEAHFPQPIVMRVGIGRIGGRSWQILQAAFQSHAGQAEHCVALAEVTLVYTEVDHPGAPMPDGLRAALKDKQIAHAL